MSFPTWLACVSVKFDESQMWWYMPIILALRGLRQDNQQLKDILCYIKYEPNLNYMRIVS